MTILILFAFLSGIVTILSPCILPVLPIVLSGSVGGRTRPYGVILGFIASFSVFTLALSSLVRALNIPPDALRSAAVALLLSFGCIMLFPWLRQKFEIAASRMIRNRRNRKSSNGLAGGLIVGMSLGLVWTPCVGPIIASVISLAVTQSVDGGAIAIILAYSLGTSIPMLAIMLGGRRLIRRFPLLTGNTERIQKVFGVLMILVGLSIGFGLDRQFQSAVLDVFPGYGEGLTAFENIEPVRKAINARTAGDTPVMMAGPVPLSAEAAPDKGRLGDYGPAPDIVTEGPWFNIAELGPAGEDGSLNMAELKGRVVLVDFWTYSCVNCVRTIPHLRDWHEAYSDEGLVIIGVHSPEFAFERSPDNVRKAMDELGVIWPVVLDNDFEQWQAYSNRYWPAHYFIDAEGRIRYYQFGEGNYDTAEGVIRALLDEAGTLSSRRSAGAPETENRSRTPEIYLGYGRTEGFVSDREILRNHSALYTPSVSLENGGWTLDGTWTFYREYIVADETGVLELGFHSKYVFLVIEPADGKGWIEVSVDGKNAGDTPDVRDGILLADDSRLYQLVKLPKSGRHTLSLKVHGGLRLFAFTFG